MTFLLIYLAFSAVASLFVWMLCVAAKQGDAHNTYVVQEISTGHVRQYTEGEILREMAGEVASS